MGSFSSAPYILISNTLTHLLTTHVLLFLNYYLILDPLENGGECGIAFFSLTHTRITCTFFLNKTGNVKKEEKEMR